MELIPLKPSSMIDEDRIDYITFLINELEIHTQSFPSIMNRLRKMQEDFDTQHNDIYHMLESVSYGEIKLGGVERTRVMNKMINLEGDRRSNKCVLEKGEALEKVLNSKEMPSYRTELNKELKGVVSKHEGIASKRKARSVEMLNKMLGEDK